MSTGFVVRLDPPEHDHARRDVAGPVGVPKTVVAVASDDLPRRGASPVGVAAMPKHAPAAPRAPRRGRHARKNRVPGDTEPHTQVKSRQGSGQIGPVLTPNADMPKRARYAGPAASPPVASPAEMDRPSRPVGAQAVLPVQRFLVSVGTSLHAPNAAPVQGPNALQLPWRPIQGGHPVSAPPAKGRKGRR